MASIEQEAGDNKKKDQEQIKKMILHKYIGETSRCCYEGH